VVRTSIFHGLLIAPVLALAGCQACVADSSQPDPTAQSHPVPAGSVGRFRPRPMMPIGRLALRDAGDSDE
jgi:hypothetical protein